MESSSTNKHGPLPMREQYQPYPHPLAKYEDVVACPKLFMDTVGKLHATMRTKFMIPIIGGKDLDLHRLFVEVTSRGGIARVIEERKWKEVTAVFNFPSSATNASFILRKYYLSLLHHYEQIYYFKAKGWTTSSADASQNVFTAAAQASTDGVGEPVHPSPEIQAAQTKRGRINTAEWLPEATPAPSTVSPVTGIIDGKFESGYLVTITLGSEKLKGVLYLVPQNPPCQIPQHHGGPQHRSVIANVSGSTAAAASGVIRRRRRKKCEMKKRDPTHPKPNRSGYNFFFAEQRAMLKPLHPGKDRDISRMIGELWNRLNESEKAVYQEKAVRDKERYRIEMEGYKERLRMGQIISDAVPIQQRPPEPDAYMMMELDEKIEAAVEDSPRAQENELSSGKSDESNSEDYDAVDKDSDIGISLGVDFEAEKADEEAFELRMRAVKIRDEPESKKQKTGNECEECLGDVQVETEKESLPNEEKESAVPIEEREPVASEERVEKESVPIEERENAHKTENLETISTCQIEESVIVQGH